MVSRVHLVISRFIVSLFSVSVDVAITLIVNHVNFSVWFSFCLFESLLLSLLFSIFASAVAQQDDEKFMNWCQCSSSYLLVLVLIFAFWWIKFARWNFFLGSCIFMTLVLGWLKWVEFNEVGMLFIFRSWYYWYYAKWFIVGYL